MRVKCAMGSLGLACLMIPPIPCTPCAEFIDYSRNFAPNCGKLCCALLVKTIHGLPAVVGLQALHDWADRTWPIHSARRKRQIRAILPARSSCEPRAFGSHVYVRTALEQPQHLRGLLLTAASAAIFGFQRSRVSQFPWALGFAFAPARKPPVDASNRGAETLANFRPLGACRLHRRHPCLSFAR